MNVSEFFRIGAGVLRTTLDDKFGTILAQIGDAVTNTVSRDVAELWGPGGFLFRPSKAEPGKQAAEAIVLRAFGHEIILGLRDLRGQKLAKTLKEGELCLYGPGEFGTSQGRVLIKQDGSVTLLTTDTNTDEGKVVSFRLSPTSLTFQAPWGSFIFDASGWHLKTKAGPRMDMGGLQVPGLPSQISGFFGGYVSFQTPVFRAKASNVFLGAGEVYNPAIWAPVDPLALPPSPVSPGKPVQSQSVWVAI